MSNNPEKIIEENENLKQALQKQKDEAEKQLAEAMQLNKELQEKLQETNKHRKGEKKVFKFSGKNYELPYHQINIPGKGVMTQEQVLADKELIKELIESGSKFFTEVK
jgi:hypothetical protein